MNHYCKGMSVSAQTKRGVPTESKTLHIGMITSPVVDGGLKTHLDEIIPRIRSKGHRISLITVPDYAAEIASDVVRGCRSWHIPVLGYNISPSTLWSIPRLLKDCDLWHVHSYPHFLADIVTWLRPIHKKPLILTFHGSFHQYINKKVMYLKRLHNLVMLRSQGNIDRFIAVSEAEKKAAVEGGISEEKVEVIYNGVTDRYSDIKTYCASSSDSLTVLYLGRLTRTKNPELLVRAMSNVVEKTPAKLVMAGPEMDIRIDELNDIADDLNISDHVDFKGEVSEQEKMNLLANSKVFVHPSLQDIFAITLIEASMSGIPTIAFNANGNPEIIKHNETGMLVDSLTPEGLAEAILTILDADGHSQMGTQGRQYVLDKFSWDANVDALEKVYYQILDEY